MVVYDTIPDNELLTKLVAGEESAFAAVYLKFKSPVFSIVKKFVHAEELAEDLTQEVFIKLWESRNKLVDVQSLRAYIFTIAKNHTINNLKKTLQSDIAKTAIIAAFPPGRNITEEQLINKEYKAYLQQQLDTLPERTREVFRQCREHHRTYDEVAASIGISRNAVKKHMVNAVKHLSSAVQKDLGISLSVLLAIVFKIK
ncbi:RNA polymerase sigma-70 factor (family 1) [Pedobacter africanus]|uniref:RNA polymerase sigma-70 factor (ECF subfamily) n=1 Tax=Pedobacter africanus TaxID=151894 RepID=A0ACC6L2G5_9SPHI|nr:RNA polymerase sigma-70 factor [Pedobacter africanus]MDR6785521.1 RNA polymerase sigma-70 factor (ECF subfamily) [Pedobacter africanus]